MSFSINDIGKIFGVGKTSEAQGVVADGKIEVFAQRHDGFVPNTPFKTFEEQQIMRIFGAVQDNILIES